MVATAVLSTTMRTKAREARKEAKKLGRQPSLDSEIPMERVASHLSTTSYLSMDAVRTELCLSRPRICIDERDVF
jgi:hypothetical protein